MNKNIVETIRHSHYIDFLLNKKFLRHLMNRIESKDYRIETYETNKISLAWFDSKVHILSNGYDELALGF